MALVLGRRWMQIAAALLAVAIVGAGSAVLKGGLLRAMEDVPLIPRDVLFSDPDRTSVQISPDGRWISFLAPRNGVLNVWVAPADAPDAAAPATDARDRGIAGYSWTYLDSHLIYVQDTAGDENWRLYRLDVTTGESVLLTPESGVNAQIVAISPKHPQEIVVGLNDRLPEWHDLYRVDLRTGERALLHENEGMMRYLLDDDYNVRFAETMTPDGGTLVLARTEEGWEPFMQISMEDALTTAVLDLDPSGTKLYAIDSRDRNTAALVILDLETGEKTVVYEDPKADVSHALIHPTQKTIQAAASTYEKTVWQVLDPEIEADFQYLKTVADGELAGFSRTLDDSVWIVAYVVDDGPVRYYRYDRKKRRAEFLFTNRSALEEYTLAKMHPVIIPSRDGLELVSYLTLPPWVKTDGLRPERPLPLVLEVHGGPWSRDTWGYNTLHQWLANRGYAVLSVNFRGSVGFGKQFLNAGIREWGGKMHDDLIDAVQWAIAQGIADPDKICISGGSYGGYAALVGLTMTPDVFACGVSIVGPSNLVTLLESIPPYWTPQIEFFATRVGDHRTPEGREFLLERSPITYVDQIKKPLLIGQGANDPRVKQSESDQIVAAMQEAGIPVTYVLYPDEGHGFARPQNRLSFYAIQEAFFHQHLGGRLEPIGDDFAGSSLTVPEGASEIPGLEEALERLRGAE
ncbi:MAG TPA: S9 family peptidase [Limnochordia bacterium]|nr:S9 family peptidase [Limnochordia bacterium]